MVDVDAGSFLVIVTLAALAAILAGVVQPRLAIPVVVIEIIGGIVVGPDLLDLATPDEFIEFFSNLGLGMLFFFAGYEIDFERIRGAAAAARGARLGDLARARLRDRRASSPRPGSCCRCSTPARRWPRPRSARSSRS